jgi:predicted ATP-binding protein involved in virulence
LLKNTDILKNIKKSIDIALKHMECKNFRFNGEELVLDNKYGISQSINMLSDGVKSMFALVADIAYRCTKLNPSSKCASKTTQGVVLIDEIDMHLHPSWQQRVLKDLQDIFPKIQFIVTTHSPQVLSSMSNKHIRIIDPTKEKAIKPVINPYGKQSIVALEDIMNVDATPPKSVIKETAILKEYLSLIQAGDINNDKLHSMRKTLNKVYGSDYQKLLIADMLINKYKALQK